MYFFRIVFVYTRKNVDCYFINVDAPVGDKIHHDD